MWHSVLLILFTWAAIYLVHLGSEELRGEEARRIIPAQEMLATGDWVVPRIAGEVYANKPPLINWLIAASFAITGTQSEYTARLPSVLSLLALSLVAFFALRRRLGNDQAMIVSLVMLTLIAMIDKGRTAGIEPLFISLFGISCFLWIKWWSENRSPWLYWTIPYITLGLGCLAKGPQHLLFWGLFLAATLRSARRLKSLFHPAHLAGIIILLALFVPWAMTNVDRVGSTDDTVGIWKEQIGARFVYSEIDWGSWISHPFEILINFLPWTVPLIFALVVLKKAGTRFQDADRWDAVIHGCLISAAVGCGLLCLTPGGLPRYAMPLYPLAALVLVDRMFRLPASTQLSFARFWRAALLVIAGVAVIASVAAGCVGSSRELGVEWVQIVAGCLLVVLVAFTLSKCAALSTVVPWSAALIAAIFAVVISAVLPFITVRDHYRPAAPKIASLVDDPGGRIALFTDTVYRVEYPQHLRLLFYFRQPFLAIGESGAIPNDTALLVGMQRTEQAMQEKLGSKKITNRTVVDVKGIPFVALQIDQSAR